MIFVGYPTQCPVCFGKVQPTFHAATTVVLGAKDEPAADIAYQCTNVSCQRIFVARYAYSAKCRSDGGAGYIFERAEPLSPEPPDIPDSVSEFSPAFAEVYTQALAAHSAGLDQIYGMGLRKALEILVKDFAAKHSPKNPAEDKVRRMPLVQVIKNHIGNTRLQRVAERAAWLGNDEAHYTRRFNAHDVSHLHALIRITINTVEDELLASHLIDDIQFGGSEPGDAKPEEGNQPVVP
ncbi:MAG: hypothetical protein AAF791_04525 [Bacteroidota bacterium]